MVGVAAEEAAAAATVEVFDSTQQTLERPVGSSQVEMEEEAVVGAEAGGTLCEGLAPADRKSCTGGEVESRDKEGASAEAEGRTTR